MLSYIMPLIPNHGCYIEPFCGGATVFFAKKKSSVEVLNDKNDDLINFYRVLQNKDENKQLLSLCNRTLYSRAEHDRALILYKEGTNVEKAWALWYKINTGFSGKLDGGFSVTKLPGSSPSRRFHNYKNNLTVCKNRLENVQVENIEALKCIDFYDRETSFFYLDPPYIGADQGHYKGYTEQDFMSLLDRIVEIEGKFLLSCYPGSMVNDYIDVNNWNSFSIQQRIRARNRNSKRENCKEFKTEMLIWNYDKILIQQGELF